MGWSVPVRRGIRQTIDYPPTLDGLPGTEDSQARAPCDPGVPFLPDWRGDQSHFL
jgi:hypothetical protein